MAPATARSARSARSARRSQRRCAVSRATRATCCWRRSSPACCSVRAGRRRSRRRRSPRCCSCATRPLALGAIAALLLGAAIADARLAALDRTALAPLLGQAVDVRATLLEHPRARSFGTRVAAVSLRSGPGRGERVFVRAPAHVRWPARSAPGVELRIGGRLAELGAFDAHERRRNAHALLRASTIRATGRRRGGVLGVLDGVRARTERVLTRGLPPPQGALARGMVLGQDGALTAAVRDDFRTTGLAHLVAASGANVLLLATLVLAIAAAAGLGLSARLWLAIALVVAYVPLAGAGPSIQRAGVMGVAGLIAALAGSPPSRWYALLLAAALTLTLNPRAAEDPGWQLSFAAVLAMLALVPSLTARLRRAPRPARPCRGARGHRRRDARHGAADRAALRAPVARVAAGQPAGGAGRRAGDVARDDRGRRRPGRAGARGAVRRARDAAARLPHVARAAGRDAAVRRARAAVARAAGRRGGLLPPRLPWR